MTDIMQSNELFVADTIASVPSPCRKGAAPSSRMTKSAAVTRLLSRNKGATLAEISHATDWQTHSCRAFLTGLRKKGKKLIKEQRPNGSTAYRIVTAVSELAAS